MSQRWIITTSVVLSLLVVSGVVLGGWAQPDCRDAYKIMNSIKGDPDNFQQLLNAFYPINWAKPSDVIIAYFTNYTDPLPEECSLGTYPWRTYPGINYTYHNILYWYMRTTAIIFDIAGNIELMEFGEYLPTMTYYQLFNKTSPFVLPTQISCIKISLECKELGDLGTVTTQVGIFVCCTLVVNIKGKSMPVYCQLHTFLTTSMQYLLIAHD